MEPATRDNLKPGIFVYYEQNDKRGPSNDNIHTIGEIKDDGIIKYKGKIKVLNTSQGEFIIIDETNRGKDRPLSFFITKKNIVESGRFTGTLYIDRIFPEREPQPED